MKTLRFALRTLIREARAGELAVLVAALVIAVGSVTAIGFLTDRISQAVALQAAEVLAADLRITAPTEPDRALLERARQQGLETATLKSFPSVVYIGEDSALASVRAATDGYPLRGTVRIADKLLAPPREANGIPVSGEVWIETGLLAKLGADVGDEVELGASKFRVGAVITYRPDQSPGFGGLAPALIMNETDLAASELLAPGSRVTHAFLFAGQREDIRQFARDIEDDLAEDARLRDRGDAGRELNAAIARAARFLALASLVSLLLAAVAVAMSARRYAERRLDTAALMKSVGATQRFIVNTTLIQLVCLGLLASALGGAFGYGMERALSGVLAGWLRSELPAPSLQPLLLGAGTALILLVGFALPSVLRLARTAPLRVLRRDLDPQPISAWASYGLAVVALSLLIYWSVRDLKLLVVIVGGTLATGAALYLVGTVLVKLLSSRRGRVGVAWRYGLANVARRGGSSAIQIVAFGLGLMVLLLLTIVRNDLLAGWRTSLDAEAPNHFLINIQEEDRAGIAQLLGEAGIKPPDFTPLVRARMTAINEQPVEELTFEDDNGRNLARRGQNLSYTATLSDTNTIVDGTFWEADHSGPPQISVEIDVAEALGLKLGEQIDFDVAGDPIRATVTSFRAVEWQTFEPNFFIVFSPNALDEYPKSFITALQVPDDKRSTLLQLVRNYPSVSVIDLEAVIDQVRGVIDKAALAVQLVFGFTLAAGLVVLFAAVQATLDERRYESALLRTFGASERTVFAGLVTEFSVLGFAAGLFAAIGATAVGALAARELFELDYAIDPVLWLTGIIVGIGIVGVSGTLASRSALREPPLSTLRGN
jgi:putative ABC transport system permease protein